MRQGCEYQAGYQKHNNAEHPIWIIDRRTYPLICFVLQCGPKRCLTPQLLGFSFVLDRIIHLPVHSENGSRRGKRNLNLCADHGDRIMPDGTGAKRFSRRIKDGSDKKSAQARETSEETMDATTPRRGTLLPLSAVAYISAIQIAL